MVRRHLLRLSVLMGLLVGALFPIQASADEVSTTPLSTDTVPTSTATTTTAPMSHLATGTAPPPSTAVLADGATLATGQQLTSPGGGWRLVMQTDGNLVLYGRRGATWQSGTAGSHASRLTMQTDGNLVESTATGKVVWQARSPQAAGVQLVLAADGRVRLVTPNQIVLWNTGVLTGWTPSSMPRGSSLRYGQTLVSANGSYNAAMSLDGNLEVHASGGALVWQSNTAGQSANALDFQSDGNVVIYGHSGSPLFTTGTGGTIVDHLWLSGRGDLIVSEVNGEVWDSKGSPCATTAALAHWPIRALAAATAVIAVHEADPMAVADLVAAGAGGVILYGSSAPDDLATRLSWLRGRSVLKSSLLVMTDEEGGGVQRMPNVTGGLPWAAQMASWGPTGIRSAAATAAERLRSVGVNVDVAPVLDVDARPGPSNQNPDGLRSFSGDAPTAATDGTAFANGLTDGGVLAVAKHFPGIGGSNSNSDLGPSSTPAYGGPNGSMLQPFRAAIAAGVPAIMVANSTVPGLTSGPASISSVAITGLLRGQLGFHGLVITDSLSAGALRQIGYNVPRAALAALQAGADVWMYSAAPDQVGPTFASAVAAITWGVASGALPRAQIEASVTRIFAAEHTNACPLVPVGG